jgi:hypothetical protein
MALLRARFLLAALTLVSLALLVYTAGAPYDIGG